MHSSSICNAASIGIVAEADGIVHVPRRFTEKEWGGTETVILNLAKEQSAAGWRPEIVTSQALDATSKGKIAGIPVSRFRHCYPFLNLGKDARAAMDRKGGNLISASLLWKLLRTPHVRLYHAHAIKRLGGHVRIAARLRDKPYVVTLHGGHYDVPQAEREDLVQPARGAFEWGRAVGALLGARRTLRDADHVICVGHGEYEAARSRLPHDRVSWLPNGVDADRFADGEGARFREEHGIPAEAFLVLCLSRIDAQKNQLQLVDSFARLKKSRPDARLALAGPVTQPVYAARIRHRIEKLGLTKEVLFLPGFRNDDPALVNAYHACDVFALPSRHEPFGIVVLEAWSAGKPVVASCVGGLRRLVDDGRTGLLFDPDSHDATEALANALNRFHVGGRALRAEFGEEGRLEARKYTWTEVARRQEAIYRAAMEHNAVGKGKVRS